MRVARGVGATIKWVVIVLVGLVALVVVVAIVGLGKASSDADKQSAAVSKRISEVHVGMTRSQVRAVIGKPDSATTTTTNGLRDDLWSYGSLSTKRSYILEFQNGTLTNKIASSTG